MSSVTTVQLNVTTRARATGSQSLDLSNMLGPGGCRLLCSTLGELEDPNGALASVAQQFQWKRTDRIGQQYAMQIGSGLPEGVEELRVHLNLRGSVAEVRHEARYRVTQTQTEAYAAAPPAAMHAQVRQIANRSVNRLLALTVAHELRNRVSQKLEQTMRHSVKNSVSMKMRNLNTIQTVARVRAGATK
ncbi:MAG TPA: hypothetical protein VN924_33045 [Bryobacteraceae bacterium]|nr:hypothetical protein [Bryobacteraceae bacterium]